MRRPLYDVGFGIEASVPGFADAALTAGNDEPVADEPTADELVADGPVADEDVVAADEAREAVLLVVDGVEIVVETAARLDRAAAMSRAKLPI